MLCSRRLVFLLMLSSAVSLSGCSKSHRNRQSGAKSRTPTPPAPKHPARDAAFSAYHHPDYGVSFRYPRNFELQEKFESGSTEPLERLTGQQPGSSPVAAVLIPSDAYPNTTFRGGSLQLVVNPAVSSETCQSFAVPKNPAPRDSTGTSTIGGVLFYWWQSGNFANNMNYSTRVYTAFMSGACYEFYLEVTDSAPTVPDPAEKPADSAKILRQLEKIIATLQLHPSAENATPSGLVHSDGVRGGHILDLAACFSLLGVLSSGLASLTQCALLSVAP